MGKPHLPHVQELAPWCLRALCPPAMDPRWWGPVPITLWFCRMRREPVEEAALKAPRCSLPPEPAACPREGSLLCSLLPAWGQLHPAPLSVGKPAQRHPHCSVHWTPNQTALLQGGFPAPRSWDIHCSSIQALFMDRCVCFKGRLSKATLRVLLFICGISSEADVPNGS